jgi:hypothetical protein
MPLDGVTLRLEPRLPGVAVHPEAVQARGVLVFRRRVWSVRACVAAALWPS